MGLKTTITANYGVLSAAEDCSGALFQIPTTEVVGGDVIEIRIWGMDWEMLEPYSLYKGTDTMGAGENVEEEPAAQINENTDFAETWKHQAEFPIGSIINVEALSEILTIDNQGNVVNFATIGEDITSQFSLHGYSCIKQKDKIKLYGSARITYERTPYYKRWYWTVPIGEEGTYWFFIYKAGILKNKFSIALPDLTTGTAEPRNITLYVTDRTTQTPIINASVYVDSLYQGVTDGQGIINIDGVLTGAHLLRVTKSGYIPTDQDDLLNDSFMVY